MSTAARDSPTRIGPTSGHGPRPGPDTGAPPGSDPQDPYPTDSTGPSFEDSGLAEAAAAHGYTPEALHELLQQPPESYTPAEAAAVHDVRHAVELQPDTTVSKVLAEDLARQYLGNSTADDFDPGRVGGFVARHEDVAGLDSPAALYEGLALGYEDTPFSPADERIYSIRFAANDVGDDSIPFGGHPGSPSAMDSFGGGESGVGERSTYKPEPFTGTGFTGSADHVVPEFTRNPRAEVPVGAAIYEVDSGGVERVVGSYEGADIGWVPVNGGIR